MTDLSERLKNLTPEQRELLLKKLKSQKGERKEDDRIRPREDRSWYPMSDSQKRLWFLNQMNPDSAFYNIPTAIRIKGLLNEERLKKSLLKVLQRHEVLRASFPTDPGGEPKQTITAMESLDIDKTDLSYLSEDERETEARNIIKQHAGKVFHLHQFPLFDFHLIKLNEQTHLLSINMHHIIIDGWSLGVFINELSMIYKALRNKEDGKIDEPHLQFIDYVSWQNKRSSENQLQEQLQFWQEYLEGMPQFLELIPDKTRPAVQTYNGRHHNFIIPTELTKQLRGLAREQKVSLYVVFMAAFQLFLHKMSGQEDFGVGAPIANRNRAELESIIGYFVNTIVLRADLSNDPSFTDLVRKVQNDVAAASDHQDLPFERIVEKMAPEHDISHSPLFQVMFDLQKAPFQKLDLGDVEILIEDVEIEVAKFDLMMLMMDYDDHIKTTLEFNTDLFFDETIERFAKYFTTLLQNLAKKPQKRCSEISLLQEAERKQYIHLWNQTKKPYPKDKAVNQIFEEIVQQYGDETALEFGDAAYDFSTLNKKANQYARFLIEKGVQPDDTVALFMERIPEMFIAILGILKAGAVYVPLDTAYPFERVQFMLEDSGSKLLISQREILSAMASLKIESFTIEMIAEESESMDDANLPVQNNGQSRAYIIYTSGSTGTPKGVVVPHQAISRLVINTNFIKFEKGIRIAQVSNATFDAATLEIWGAFLTGATLIGFEKDALLNMHSFVKSLNEKKISAIFLTSAIFNQIASEIPHTLGNIKYLMTGGDKADPTSFRKVLQNSKPAYLINGYGPTENTTFSTTYEAKTISADATNIPIGKPIANSYHYILDKKFQPVPIGVPGELFLGGDGLALGYHNRPELNEERFITDPFAEDEDKKLYRSGDLVRYLPSGDVEFLGRIDHQVKIRGFRVELGEIETYLKEHSRVKDCVVVAREDLPGAKQLVAYYVPDESLPNNGSLKQFLASKLPDYMIPAAFVKLDSIPMTPNGKVDRRALPKPVIERSTAKEYVAPRNKLESYLVEIWKGILKLDRVGIHDNFFELGGNSLQAAIFNNRLQKDFNTETHVAGIFKAPTVAEFASYVVEYYPDIVRERFGQELAHRLRVNIDAALDRNIKKISEDDVKELRKKIRPLPPYSRDEQKNPRAVFVLSPPRSGSTLLRVMLAGNKELFSPPELDLLSFNTLEERYNEFTRHNLNIWLESTIRSLMEIFGLDFDTASELMREKEKSGMSTKAFYRFMQENIGDRMLVDKTPSYPFDIHILERAEEDFDQPFYIHLTRHPYAMIYSFMEAKLDQTFFRHEHPYNRRELAELIWYISHQNILDFKASIPKERYYRMRFEDLVQEPEQHLQTICGFLGITFDEEMLKPYHGKKMTDAARKNSQMVGDFKFYLHRNINTKVIDRWREHHKEDFLSDISWELASQLGYETEKNLSSRQTDRLSRIPKISRSQPLPLSYAQQRLWFLEHLEPGNPQYNIPVAIHMKGKLEREPFSESLIRIFSRHEALRTTFYREGGQPLQRIHSDVMCETNVEYLYGVSLDDPKIKKKIIEESKKPFDIENGPLVRFRYLVLAEDELVLIMVVHHIIADGWSLGVFFKEFAMLYDHYLNNTTINLPQLPIQYADYAAWQRSWLNDRIVQRQLSYWNEQLAGIPSMIQLPTDHPRLPVKTTNGRRLHFRINENLSRKIKQFTKTNNTTLFNVLLSAFQLLLHRYSGQDDILTGTPNAYRNRSEIENLIGFFVNTLVIRTQFKADINFKDLLQQVRNTTMEAFDNQDIPFEKLVDELEPERDMSHTPIFQVMFSMQPTELRNIHLQDLSIQPLTADTETAKFDMTLGLLEKNAHIVGEWEYNTDLFEEPTIRRFIDHYRHLLSILVDKPNEPINKVRFLKQEEEYEVLKKWNDKRIEFESEATLAEIFERQTQITPNQIAIIDDTNQLTFEQFNQRANQLAHILREKGIGPETIVGVIANRKIDSIVAVMAILKAGGAYMPIDPFYPKGRIDYMIEDAELSLIVAPDSQTIDLSQMNCPVLYMDAMHNELEAQSVENPTGLGSGDHIAYVIYTSGSTGQPKGVMLSNKNAMNLVANLEDRIYKRFEDSLRVSLNAPLSFDASVKQLVMITRGHTLTLIPHEVRLDGEAFLQYISDQQIDVLDCVPSQLKLLLEAGLLTNNKWKPKAVIPGGEAIDMDMWQTLSESRFTKFFNLYGPTECAVDSTVCDIASYPEQPVIGTSIANIELYVLDENLQPAPYNVPGELHISGASVGRGYYNRPGLTAEKFIPNPFSDIAGMRMYKTGDLVSLKPDGNMKFHGRVDHQVKVRGFRIELGEIEAILKKYDDVKDGVVIVREDKPKVTQITAYFVKMENTTVDVNDLLSFMKEQLPEYMIPTYFINIPAIPLTPNGKLDRRELPVPGSSHLVSSSDFVAPSTERERILADIWKELLNLQMVSKHDNFFEVGGDSIVSIQVITRARQMGLHLTPKDLFENPTIEKLAAAAKEATTFKAEQGLISGTFELTPIQQDFFERAYANHNHYNQSLMLEVKQALQPDILEKTLWKILEHHDALRLRFKKEETGWRQWYDNELQHLPFETVDLSNEDDTHLSKLLQERAEQTQQSLDIENGPLFRMVYYHLNEQHNDRLHIVCHHLIIDGVSWRILLEDIYQAYRQAEEEREIRLPLKTTSFKSWMQALIDHSMKQELKQQADVWFKMFEQIPPTLPADFEEGSNIEAVSRRCNVNMDQENTEALLRDVPPVFNTQIMEILIVALLRTFYNDYGQSRLYLHMEGHGRENITEEIDISRTLGWFTTLYPFQISVSNPSHIGETIKSVKEQIRKVPHNGIGFGLLKYLSDDPEIKQKLSQIPKPPLVFNYLGQFNQMSDEQGPFAVRPAEESGHERAQENQRDHLLDFSANIRDGQFNLTITYSAERFKAETIDKIANAFIAELKRIIEFCQQTDRIEYTASDFRDVDLDEEELDDIMSELTDNEDDE